MKFSLFANTNKDSNGTFLNKVKSYILSLGSDIVYYEVRDKGSDLDTSLLKGTDIIITMGGDGTLLDIAQKTKFLNIPIVGINLGTVGFLTQVEKENYKDCIDALINEEYGISNRMMLHARIVREGKTIFTFEALNDIVVNRIFTGDTVAVSLKINGAYIDTYDGDGMIISSPTGSTAYQMSAGGPVSDPEAELMLMTPICPHMMHRQTYIIKPDGEIQLKIKEDSDTEIGFSYDGITLNIKGEDDIIITKSDIYISLIRMGDNSFYENLRNKIYYRGESK